MVKTIGLTGGIATGKSAVAKILSQNGVKIIDADIVAKDILFNNSKQVVKLLGNEVLVEGCLDKAKIKQLIFNHPEIKQKLEDFIHPLTKKEIKRQISQLKQAFVAVEVPLLFQAGWHNEFDLIWLVKSQQQRIRILARDNIDPQLANKIINSQNQYDKYQHLADSIIVNDFSLSKLEIQVKQLFKKIVSESN